MGLILNIETSGKNCSVALAQNGSLLMVKEFDSERYVHAEKLHLFIEEVLKGLKVSIKDLTAIAVSEGPGSYTGLRIGVATAKGLAYALGVPLIAVSSLLSLTVAAKKKRVQGVFCPMIDARRMEVYTCVYNDKFDCLRTTEAAVVDDEYNAYLTVGPIYYFGDGAEKCISQLPESYIFLPKITLSASNMVEVSYEKFIKQDFVELAYFEPFYLKEFRAGRPKKMF